MDCHAALSWAEHAPQIAAAITVPLSIAWVLVELFRAASKR